MAQKTIENFKNGAAVIAGERIYLKIMQAENATADYAGWLNDPEVNKYLETKGATVEELKNYITEKLADDNCLFFGIFIKAGDKHIGNVKLEPIDWEKKFAVFGILIGDKNYWGQGLATEATKLIIDLAFNKLNLETLELGVIAENAAAMKVYKKIGFKVDKINKAAVHYNGRPLDQIIMTIKK